MVGEFRFGLMDHATMVTGNLTEPVAKEGCSIMKETFMRENGTMIWQMALAITSMQMVAGTKETGKTISSMVLERNSGLMDQALKGIITWVRNRGKESSNGLMGACMWESLEITISMVRECTSGQMAGLIMAIGRTIK